MYHIELCTLTFSLSPSISVSVSPCVLPDPSLTPENLSSVLDSMKDWLWDVFSQYVNIPQCEIDEIKGQYSSDRERKQAIVPHLISTHPSLSWRVVAHALYQVVICPYVVVYGVDADSSHRALDHLQQKFPTGNTYIPIIYPTSLRQ